MQNISCTLLRRVASLTFFGAALLLTPILAQAQSSVVISEFLTHNSNGLLDEDGVASDWIEIYNSSSSAVNLGGWALTDDPSNLTKWVFPSTNIAAKGFLVVFASGKNRTTPGLPLHTSFALSSSGGYLALVMPGGVTIANDFTYPSQRTDISYGLLQSSATTYFVTTNSTARVLIPTGPVAATWVTNGFDDSSWRAATNGVGYETSVPGFAVRNFKASASVVGAGGVQTLATAESVIATPANQAAVYAENSPVVNYLNTGSSANYANDRTVPGFIINADQDEYVIEATATITIPAAGQYTFGVNSDDGFRLTIGSTVEACDCLRGPTDTLQTFTFAAAGDYPLRLVFFEHGGGSEVELFAATGSFGAWDSTHFHLVGDTASGGLAVRSVPIASGSGIGYRQFINTDVQSTMLSNNATALIRIPFSVANAASVSSLTLQMQYDDGFVAYINGQEVARRNAPASPAWNSTATASHLGNTYENINLSDRLSVLQTGNNVLAIQGLNDTANGTDFLIAAQLVDFAVATVTNQQFFSPPTPGAANANSFAGFVGDTSFDHDRGFYETNFSLAITTATPGAFIRYTTNGSVPTLSNGIDYTGPIPINSTRVIRAVAFKTGFSPSNPDTQTYIFLSDVIRQPEGVKPGPDWPDPRPRGTGAQSYDYGMDQTVINRTDVNPTIVNDLKSLPTYSLVCDLKDLFDPATGIYANPSGDTFAWERPCSLELIYPDGTKGYHVNAGVRIRGGYSRSPDNPKHGFRIFLRSEYGAGSLSYPVAGPDATTEFQKFDLRTFQNYSWSFDGSGLFTGLRDISSRDSQLAMGQPASHGFDHHLYINGQYWGIYQIDERPEANFGASYFGGDATNYDTIKVNPDDGYVISNTDGNFDAWLRLWMQATNGFTDARYFQVQGLNPDGTPNPAYENLIDVDNLIDYMLVILWGGNLDAPISNFLGNTSPNNFFAVRNRDGLHGGFRFMAHDSEHTLLDVNADRTGPFPAGDPVTGGGFPKSNPQYIFQQMWSSPEFKIKMADLAQKHLLSPGGALTAGPALSRFYFRSNEIFQAVNAESARWGNANHSPAFLRNPDWLNTMRSVATFFATRTPVVLGQLKAHGLFPALGAPVFSQVGGSVPSGYTLTLSNTNATGTIYYTVDGSDPRKIGGAISPSAISYTGPISINVHTFVRARVKDGANWSPLVEANFFPAQDFTHLLLTEINYNPLPFSTNSGDNLEFLELKNTGTVALDLSLLQFTNAINFTFTNGTMLAPGQFFVVGRSAAALASRYPGITVNGIYTKKLGNGGDTITLLHPTGTTLFSVTYNNAAPWPITPDGHGFTLVPIDPNNNPDMNSGSNWRGSSAPGGSPGADDPTPTTSPILVNEILSVTDSVLGDAIELYNPTTSDANIGGWFLTDDKNVPQKYRIPDGTMIPANGFRVFRSADFDATPGTNNSFGLSSLGEEVYLVSGDANTNLTGYSHGFDFGPAATNVTFGRYVISTGEEQFPAMETPTLGAPNSKPKVGPVVINEIMYHPDIGFDEFIELRNITGATIPLYDPNLPTNTWKLSGLGFDFPTNTAMAPDSFLLLVPIDPATFRTKYNVPGGVPILGPYPGTLQNSGERLQLQFPGAPTTNSSGQIVIPYITMDEVRYNDKAPWPVGADGSGPSLQKWVSGDYGNDPTNWFAFGSSPGAANRINQAPTATVTSPASGNTYAAPVNITFTASANDPDGSVVKVEYFADGQKIGEASSSPYSVTWVNVPSGTHSVVARALDNNFATGTSTPISITVNPYPAGTGTGLNGDYYQSASAGAFTTLKLTRVDPMVNFDWGTGSPDPAVPADLFAVRWTGLVQPRLTDTYAFYTLSDDGVRLWVDNQLLIDNWTDHGQTENIGTIPLTAGQPYQIRMEYYENGGGAAAKLSWSATGLPEEFIPQTQLYPFTNTDTRIVRQPIGTNIVKGSTLSLNVLASGFLPKTYQWFRDTTNVLVNATNSTLSIANIQPGNAGIYTVIVSDVNTNLVSSNAVVNVLEGPVLTAGFIPIRATITSGDSFTLSATASGTLPISFSWRKNFIVFTNDINSSGTSTIFLTNILPATLTGLAQTNTYTVRLTNVAAQPVITYTNAILRVLNPPVITNQPVTLVRAVGGNATFSIGTRGGTPQRNQWYRNGSPLLNQTNLSLNLANVQIANEGNYVCIVTNLEGTATSATASLIIDSDGDGIPDSYELARGWNPNNPADALADDDHDGMSNLAEYIAGTDPQDATSYLRIDGTAGNSAAVLKFLAITNRSYTIESRTLVNTGAWNTVTNFPAAFDSNRLISITHQPQRTNRQTYRLGTQKVQ